MKEFIAVHQKDGLVVNSIVLKLIVVGKVSVLFHGQKKVLKIIPYRSKSSRSNLGSKQRSKESKGKLLLKISNEDAKDRAPEASAVQFDVVSKAPKRETLGLGSIMDDLKSTFSKFP
jgi:hypothetical protein